MISFFNSTFNEDLKNGLYFIPSSIFDEYIHKNDNALRYQIQQICTNKKFIGQRQIQKLFVVSTNMSWYLKSK